MPEAQRRDRSMEKPDLRNSIPWWLRISAKIVLARLPVPYSVWKRIGIFEHGFMDEPERALRVFLAFAEATGLLPDRNPSTLLRYPRLLAGKSVLEIGPGDSLFTALVASSVGSARTWLVDSGDYASRAIQPYAAMTAMLKASGFATPWQSDLTTIEAMTKACACTYLTDGLNSLKRIPAGSIDFCFSNAVLEHIPCGQFGEFINDLYRVMSPNGVAVHRVDLTDHLGGGLNNLRFSDKIWESSLFSRSGFYTNRLRFSEIAGTFRHAGFDVTLPRIIKWDALPLPKSRLNERFRSFDDDDLRVLGFDVLASKSRLGEARERVRS